ncbi:hypothetical protein K474DRAFT_1690650 [Panus rudis PR-1116 ss-1]|nr:hypothetical protein K474DRAFT_1690650 [Panus rudis PR-1116 ss-1]
MQAAAFRRVVARRAQTSLAAGARTYATPVPWSTPAPAPPTPKEQEDDPQLGDYPRLPWVSKQTRPARGWEDPQMRRNFGEPLHEKEEILSMWGPDIPVVPPPIALRWFSMAVASFVTFGVIVKFALVPDRPAVPREYPFDGLVTELGGLEENKARPEAISDEE